MGRNRQENHEVFWYRSKGSPSPLISGIVHLSSNACCGGGSHACVSDAGRELRPEIARRTLASTILKIFWTLQRGGGVHEGFQPERRRPRWEKEDSLDGMRRRAKDQGRLHRLCEPLGLRMVLLWVSQAPRQVARAKSEPDAQSRAAPPTGIARRGHTLCRRGTGSPTC